MVAELVTTTLTVIEYSDTRLLQLNSSEPTAALLSILTLWSSGMVAELVTTTLTVIEYSDTRLLQLNSSEPTAALLSILWSSSTQMFVAHVSSDCRLQLMSQGIVMTTYMYGLACPSQPTKRRRFIRVSVVYYSSLQPPISVAVYNVD
jgi:hypothetical protein